MYGDHVSGNIYQTYIYMMILGDLNTIFFAFNPENICHLQVCIVKQIKCVGDGGDILGVEGS